MAEDPEKQPETVSSSADAEQAVSSSADADAAAPPPETTARTDSPQASSSPDDATSPPAEDASATPPHGDELAGAVAETDEERASEDAEEAPAAESSEDAEEAPAAESSESVEETPVAEETARAASTPRRRRGRGGRQPGEPAPVVRAQAKYVRSSARKARLVCDHIRGKSVEEARAILAVTPRAIARDWSKLLESAVANAEHNHELVGEDLVVKAAHADEGPTIKRFRPRAMGRATRIRKRTSHLTILLTPKD